MQQAVLLASCHPLYFKDFIIRSKLIESAAKNVRQLEWILVKKCQFRLIDDEGPLDGPATFVIWHLRSE